VTRCEIVGSFGTLKRQAAPCLPLIGKLRCPIYGEEGGWPVANNLKMFERLGYAALALGLVSDLIGRKVEMIEAILIVIVTLAAAALVWAAARKAQGWAAAIVGLIAILALIGAIGEFWVGGPAWLQDIIKSETSSTPLTKTLDVVVTVMLFAALYFYYFAGDEQTA
jgi:hypothetical protein